MLVTTRYGHTVRLLTILRKSTDTFGAAWREGREPVVFQSCSASIATALKWTPQDGTESEQIAHKRVDHGHCEPDD